MKIHFTVEKIEAMLKAFNLSQTELSKRLGISQVYINQIIRGERNISTRVQKELNRVYGELLDRVKVFENQIS
ncbi:helix-turn-helix transcriptional regulator [Jeotgalibacillus haloalkalitolerans]|uniref:Helix-turn-helix transcriptional regulator n=1 Tax=Jeotgalibacillus haloalkalitolerans TaxID=3104292 RepID=A0ABU5KQ14_9BACL|nr:helix-turn-helix transcriptional regulator [Jeotgalibacillus sp. HH7-29]MDZ5712785.1 helix-turn-helix transcriptional regulator [Jeotgalibacillus sp. HH7-29]